MNIFQDKEKISTFPSGRTGTEFQQKVWERINANSLWKNHQYLQLAQRLGNVKVIRAAAFANGRNQLCIVIPCHRVIGSDGSLTGYGGGLPTKKMATGS